MYSTIAEKSAAACRAVSQLDRQVSSLIRFPPVNRRAIFSCVGK
jgi:hypothetical protein